MFVDPTELLNMRELNLPPPSSASAASASAAVVVDDNNKNVSSSSSSSSCWEFEYSKDGEYMTFDDVTVYRSSSSLFPSNFLFFSLLPFPFLPYFLRFTSHITAQHSTVQSSLEQHDLIFTYTYLSMCLLVHGMVLSSVMRCG